MEKFILFTVGALFWIVYLLSLAQQKSQLEILISALDVADNETCFSINKIAIPHNIWSGIAANFTITVLEKGRVITGFQSSGNCVTGFDLE